ncbi:MAG: hypothetical protein WC614_10850 [bacterium]
MKNKGEKKKKKFEKILTLIKKTILDSTEWAGSWYYEVAKIYYIEQLSGEAQKILKRLVQLYDKKILEERAKPSIGVGYLGILEESVKAYSLLVLIFIEKNEKQEIIELYPRIVEIGTEIAICEKCQNTAFYLNSRYEETVHIYNNLINVLVNYPLERQYLNDNYSELTYEKALNLLKKIISVDSIEVLDTGQKTTIEIPEVKIEKSPEALALDNFIILKHRELIKKISDGRPISKKGFESLVTNYRKIQKNKSANIEELWSLAIKLSQERLYDYAIEICKKLIKNKPDCAEFYYYMGLVYFQSGAWDWLKITKSKKAYKLGIIAFKKSLSLGKKSYEVYPELLRGYGILGDREHFNRIDKKCLSIEFKDKVKNLDWREEVLASIIYVERTRLQAVSMYKMLKEEKYRDAYILLNQAIRVCQGNLYFSAYFLLSSVCDLLNRPYEAVKACIKCRELEPRFGFSYYRIGLYLLHRLKFKSAALYFKHAAEICYRYHDIEGDISTAKYHYALGMLSWENGALPEAYQHFLKYKEFIKYSKTISEIEFEKLTELVDVDKKINNFPKCNNFHELEKNVIDVFIDLQKLFPNPHSVKQPLGLLILAKFWFLFDMIHVLDPTFEGYNKLKESINQYPPEDIVPFSEKRLGVHLSKKFYTQLHFIKGMQAVNRLENFILEIKSYSEPSIIPQEKQIQLIKTLSDLATVCDGEASRYVGSRLISQVSIIENLQELQSQYNELKKEVKEGFIQEYKLIEEHFMKINSIVQEQKTKLKIQEPEEKFTKVPKEKADYEIITNKGPILEGFCTRKDFEKFEANFDKSHYNLWLHKTKYEFFINGKQKIILPPEQEYLIAVLKGKGELVSNKELTSIFGTYENARKYRASVRKDPVLEKYIRHIIPKGDKLEADVSFCLIIEVKKD